MEEALETIHGLGVAMHPSYAARRSESPDVQIQFYDTHDFDLIEAVDGCADLSVVTIGTLSALGVKDDPILEAVDANNLLKIKNGTRDQYGKLIKPVGHPKPPILQLLNDQGYQP